MDTGSFIISIKIGDVYKDMANDAEERFDILNFKDERPLRLEKRKSDRINERIVRQKDYGRVRRT